MVLGNAFKVYILPGKLKLSIVHDQPPTPCSVDALSAGLDWVCTAVGVTACSGTGYLALAYVGISGPCPEKGNVITLGLRVPRKLKIFVIAEIPTFQGSMKNLVITVFHRLIQSYKVSLSEVLQILAPSNILMALDNAMFRRSPTN
jgi:hypothetical protein